jgi:hypothetical protein
MAKHNCAEFEWKVDYQGKTRCVCGEIKAPAITDNFPAGKADTSREAFTRHKRSKTLERVLNLIRGKGEFGMTADEAAAILDVEQATTSARFNDLKRHGAIAKATRRNTRRGRKAWAWKVT